MASNSPRRRPRSHIEDDGEADAVRLDESSPSGSSDIFKRLRLRGGDGGEDIKQDDSDQGFSSPPPRAENRSRKRTRENGEKPRFQPGAIVRVSVENFVTYERAEFFPGPNLNMVIGPNGTGKSSLVCAVCLGLGYHSNVLGRASAFGEFVKHGQDHAVVEIELQKRPQDNQNVVVRLRITREDNSRKFWVNGRESTHKGVQKIVQSLRIQIDNLCQFLPQDKVAEFAGLNSVDLLTKTLQAAAPEEMMVWQEKLKELFNQQKDAQDLVTADAEQLTRLESRQDSLQADVQKLREREKIKQLIEELRTARLMVIYDEARKEFTNCKRAKRDAERALRDLQNSFAPSLQAVNDKQEYQGRIEQVFQERKKALRNCEAAADEIIGEMDVFNTKMQDLANKGEAETAAYQAKRKELSVIRRKITDLEAAYKQIPKQFNAAEWNTKIREQEHLQRENHAELQEVEEEITRIKGLGTDKQTAAKKIKRELEQLDSQQGQMLTQLKRMNPDVAKGWEWIIQNQDQFEKEVFGPPMLTCTVKDEKYSDLVQSVLQLDDFFCFTAQTREDHRKLSNQLYKEMGLSATIRTCQNSFGSFQPPLSRERLPELGLDGYIIDYLEGPEPVLAMLCAEKRLHASAIALKDISDAQYKAILDGAAINSFAAGKQSYRVTRRREYGASAASTRVKSIDPGRFWTNQPVDMTEKTELNQNWSEIQDELSQLKAQLNESRQKKEELEKAGIKMREKLDELRTQKGELQQEFNRWRALPDKIETEKKTLEEKRGELADAKTLIRDLEDQGDKIAVERSRMVLRHKEKVTAIRAAHLSLLEAQVRLIEAKSDVLLLQEKNVEIHQRLEDEKRSLEEMEGSQEELRRKAKKALDAVKAVPEEIWDQSRMIELGKDKSVADIDSDIHAETTRLDVIEAGNPHALDEFEKRATDIERLRREKGRREHELRDLRAEIEELRGRWEPRLDELIGRINDAFSHNFEQISCAGEVGVHKDEDFDKWAIEIKVKFRENETLQKLDQHRQSGGERAVSTIFYLMSLQSMAQAPFRVVDEINQGMDPRNERMVHERMVEIACREHTSQYFLITPKLLPGLRYDERMTVLCIASGEHMPTDGAKLDLARCAKIQRRLVAAAAVA